MSADPERAVAFDQLPPEALEKLVELYVGGFIKSRLTKREARQFLAGCDEMADLMETAQPLIRPAPAALRDAALARWAAGWHRKNRAKLEALI